MVAAAIKEHAALVRVNPPRTDECAADLDVVAPHAAAIRIPKCESADDVLWVAARAGGLPLVPAIETARGVLAAQEIACVPGVAHLSIGGLDLLRDLYAGDGALPMLYVRSAPRRGVPGSRAAPARRQRLPADRRRRGVARRGGVRPVAGLRGEVRDPPAADPDPARGVRAVGARTGVGAAGARGVRGRRAAGRPGSRTASSSTCRWPSARSGSWRSPATMRQDPLGA